MIKFKLFANKSSKKGHELDYCLLPTVTIRIGRVYDLYDIFVISLRFLKWYVGFTIFWNVPFYDKANQNNNNNDILP
ncbi:hypothetical protein ES707_11021 [subsurface metagenome]